MASLKNTTPFNPRSIAGCQLWLDAFDVSTMTFSSGSNLQTWRNKGDQGGVFTQAGTESRLTYSSSNNYPIINFDSDGASLNAWMSGTIPFTANTTCFQVITPIAYSVGTWSFYWSWQWSSVGNRLPGFRSLNSSRAFEPYITWVGNNNNSIPVTNGRSYLSFVEFTGGGANTQYSINGNSPSTGTIAASNVNSSTFLLGGDGNAGATVWGKMYLSEILVFSNVLTTSQRQQIEGYLSWKWGLTTSLPFNHPFKNGPVPFSFSLAPSKTQFTQIFDPRSISGLQLWLDAATSFPTHTNGQAITRWVDKTSNGWIGTAVNSPTYQTNVQNGLPVIRFNGTNQYIDFGNILNLGTNGLSIFVVTKFVAAVSGGRAIVSKSPYRGNPGRSGFNYQVQFALGMDTFIEDGTNAQATFAFNPATQFNVYSTQNNRTSFNRNFANGRLGAASSYTQIPSNLSNTDKLYVAAYPNNTGLSPQAGYYLNGDIGEILVYFANLSDAQRQQIEGYLARKWGVSLVSTHPNANTLTIAPFPYAISRISMTPTAKWRPTQVSGCALWLDAADSATVILTGTDVTQWNDKSGNGRNVTKTSAATNPVYTVGSLNRLPVLVNTGTSGLSGTLAVNTLTNMTIFIVCNDTNAAELVNNTGGYVMWWNETGGWGQIQMYVSQSRLDWRFGSGQAENKPTFNLPSNVSTNYNIACISKSSLAETGFLNGNVVGSYTAANAAIANTSSSFVITGPVGATYATNNVAEILIFTSSISIFQRQQVEGYLAWKWGLQANLPSAHPYAKFPPTP